MDKAKIPEDEWRTKREDRDLAYEYKTTGTRASLSAGLKAWLESDFYAQQRGKCFALPKSTKTIGVDDNA
jgi:hypothetical protein